MHSYTPHFLTDALRLLRRNFCFKSQSHLFKIIDGVNEKCMLEIKLQLLNESLRTFPQLKNYRRIFNHNNAIVLILKYEKKHHDDVCCVVNEKQSNADVRDAAQLIYNRKNKLKKNTIKNQILMSPCITVTIDSSTIIIALLLLS